MAENIHVHKQKLYTNTQFKEKIQFPHLNKFHPGFQLK